MRVLNLCPAALGVFVSMVVIMMAFPGSSEAHLITGSMCTKASYADMVANQPHTHAQRRATFFRCLKYARSHNLSHRLARCQAIRYGDAHTRWAIRRACKIKVVWPYNRTDREAVTVAWCEGTFNPGAVNGEYRGTFQMGSGERKRWGHGSTLVQQTLAASRYYRYARGIGWSRGWGPWSCKPGSGANQRAWQKAPAVLRNYVR